ncbi:fimbrial chaperone protein [Yersinia aldovae ATCC 35236]|nr:fimbrial chaperone protein [Yersinia aldovae ATCC 35236]
MIAVQIISLMFISNAAYAGVIITGSRLIYDSSKKEASVAIRNPDEGMPYLIQSWVDNYSSNNTQKPPFVVTPPLFRLDGKQENILRVMLTGGALPNDKESIFWVNIKAIPATQKNAVNRLSISINSKMKLIYRPRNLFNGASEAYKKVTFSRVNNQLQITNPTPYYISFSRIYINNQPIKESVMVSPFDKKVLSQPIGASAQISWGTINDYGGITPRQNVVL